MRPASSFDLAVGQVANAQMTPRRQIHCRCHTQEGEESFPHQQPIVRALVCDTVALHDERALRLEQNLIGQPSVFASTISGSPSMPRDQGACWGKGGRQLRQDSQRAAQGRVGQLM
jgi:hypothetical protein